MSSDSPLVTGSLESDVLVLCILADQLREASVAYRLRDDAISVIDRFGVRNLVVDLGKTKQIGSVGFLAFLALRRHLAGGRIVLCNMSDPIRDMFAVCRLIPTEHNATAPFETEAALKGAIDRLALS